MQAFRRTLAAALVLAGLTATRPGRANQLDNIHAAGVLRVAVLQDEPPLSSVDPGSHEPVGYEIDIARAIARRIGVRLQTIVTPLAQRIPLLRSGGADLIVADLTITEKRAAAIEFSIPYLVTGLQMLVRDGAPDRIASYAYSRIGADRGSTQQDYLAADFRAAQLVLFDDAPQALQALRDRRVDAIVQDSIVLAGLLTRAPDRREFKGLPDFLTHEDIGVGLRRTEQALLDTVNVALLDLELSGQAARIYHAWFDAFGDQFRSRNFAITVPCDALSGWSLVTCPPARLPH
jgi:polar amino acid transport system substrate-binding protein